MKTGITFYCWVCLLIASGCGSNNEENYAAFHTANFTVKQEGSFTAKPLDEISGIAISRTHEDVLWLINDSGDDPVLYAARTNGEFLGQVSVQQADNRDWEELSSFVLHDQSYLLIADTGDNDAVYETVMLYIVKEPELYSNTSVTPEWRISFQFEDGPRDCESVAVDVVQEKIYLLTKREQPNSLYVLPLRPDPDEQVIARRLGPVHTIPPPNAEDIRKGGNHARHSQTTSMDFSPDRSFAAILTYRHMFFYQRSNGMDWYQALQSKPLRFEYPALRQAEAICFADSSTSLFITTEKRPAPIQKVVVMDTSDW